MNGVLDRVRTAVAERGGRLDVDGEEVSLTMGNITVSRRAAVVQTAEEFRRLARTAPRGGLEERIVLLDSASPQRARFLRDAGAWYVDADGRMHVRAQNLVIDVDRPVARDRRTRAAEERVRRRWGTTMNMMSPARAQAVCVLLEWPHLVSAPVRELAEIAGTSFGSAAQVLAALREDGYVSRRPVTVLRPDALLDLWVAAFPRGLGTHLELRRFAGEPTTDGWVRSGRSVHVSGDAAVDGLRGPGLVLYVDDIDQEAVVRSRWRASDGPDANIVVRRRFWTEPSRDLQSVSRAPLPLVLGDLIAGGDSRQLEVAGSVREQILDRLR